MHIVFRFHTFSHVVKVGLSSAAVDIFIATHSYFFILAGFMKVVEADAKERAKRKKERMKVAEGYKEKGNNEFRQGNFETALDWYTQVCIIYY